jgi:hypothetical protein
MVEPTFLAVGAVVFFILLIIILRNSAGDEPQKPKRERNAKPAQPKPKQKKPTKKTNKKKQVGDDSLPTEWDVEDSRESERKEVMEFLRGKDPAELARIHGQNDSAKPRGNRKNSATADTRADVVPEGFEVVSTKKPTDKKSKKKNKKKEQEQEKKSDSKGKEESFFKALPGSKEAIELEKKKEREKERRQRKLANSSEDREGGEKRKKPEGSEGEQPREKKRRDSEDRPKREKQERPPRPARITSPPNVKYEEADLNDILNSITQDFKAKPKTHRVSSLFSKIPRNIVIERILSRLAARDLIAVSEVNHFFMNAARKDSLWKELLLKDFGIRDNGKVRNFRAAYRAEYKKRRNRKNKQESPEGEAKDGDNTEAPVKGKGKGIKKEKKTEEVTAE